MASPVEPLVLDYGISQTAQADDAVQVGPCLLCREEFNLSNEDADDFLKHLLEVHKLVIGDVERVANLKSYVEYWRPRLARLPLEAVCVQMEDNTEEGRVYYYMLCSILKEDRQVRSELSHKRLQHILNLQQLEREDNSTTWNCLFCGEIFTGNRSLVLNHMKKEHNFNIGHPDNLVNVQKFLRKLRETLDRLLCLYCEKTFKDKFTLKEHMRKKLHKKLNPNNKEYDEFYLVNYLELGKDSGGGRTIRRGKGGVKAYITSPTDSDAEEDWQESTDSSITEQSRSTCLFCTHTAAEPSLIFAHMSKEHGFDFSVLTRDHKLNFYSQVKIINYIRRQMLEMKCVRCVKAYTEMSQLLDHIRESSHITSFMAEKVNWDQPEYYFPTYENDNLLSGLDCEEDSFAEDGWVIPEEVPSVSTTQGHMLGPLLEEAERKGDVAEDA